MTFSIIDPDNLLDDELRQHVERRILFATSRFDSRIIQTEVTVASNRRQDGVVVKHCQVTVDLQRATRVSVTETDADLTTCISRAAERTGRAVGRSIDLAKQVDGKSTPPRQCSIAT